MSRLTRILGSRGVPALVAAALVAAAAPGAAAAVPAISLTNPAAGSVTNNTMPLFQGSTVLAAEESFPWEPITLKVYAGTSTSTTPIEEMATIGFEPGADWFVDPALPLSDGTYTAQASEETEAEPAVPIETAPVTFRIDTTPPTVSVARPAGALAGAPVAVEGSAGTSEGDLPAVTLQVFAGAEAAGAPIEAIEVPAHGGAWAGTLAGLSAGSYTLRAEQSDSAGNLGLSAPVGLSVSAPTPPAPPAASFRWFPEEPRAGEAVTLVSSSTDTGSAITSYSWSTGGPFASGGPVLDTTFASPGPHTVRLMIADAAGRSALATETILVHHHVLTLMQPFPIVRIAGSETRRGVHLTLVTVAAPPGALVTVRTKGRGVKPTTSSRVARIGGARSSGGAVLLSFPRFARSFAAGTVLEIRVTKPEVAGKLTLFTIRRGKLPLRSDTCLGSSGQPVGCPSS